MYSICDPVFLCVQILTCEGLKDVCQIDRNFLPDPGLNENLPVLSDSRGVFE